MANIGDLIKDVLAPIIANVGLLSILAWLIFIFGRKIFLRPLNDSIKFPILLGLVFGTVSAIVMLLPIELSPGVITDTRGVPVLFAGIIGGPISAVIAALISALARTLIGGPGWLAGSTMIVFYGVSGVIVRHFFRGSPVIPSMRSMVVIASLATATSLPAILLLPQEFQFGVLTQIMPQLLVANIIGCLTLGSLIGRVEKRYLLEQALAKTKDELRQFGHILSSSTDLLALLDTKFIYLAANAAYLKAFGLTRDAVVGRSVPDIFGETVFNATIRPHADRCLTGEDIRFQEWFEFPAAGRKYMDVIYTPYFGTGTDIQGFVVTAHDITERKQAELVLKKTENKRVATSIKILGRPSRQNRLANATTVVP